uniref:Lysozyme family protein n=1 Tax=Myoviridae sp. ctyD07 TaxID=2826716 RepID=A0A8S5NJE7_9CAUD|nr:MAG TPA: Lysozyme family protein [Myoviridae sp. ctyD07]
MISTSIQGFFHVRQIHPIHRTRPLPRGRLRQSPSRPRRRNQLGHHQAYRNTKLGTFTSFGKGWVRRVAQNLIHAAADNTD